MIHLIDEYYAKVDTYGYALVKDAKRTGKNGDMAVTALGYCGSLTETIELLIHRFAHEKLQNRCIGLSQALNDIKGESERVRQAITSEIGDEL